MSAVVEEKGLADRVLAVLEDSLFRPAEVPEAEVTPKDAVVVPGIVRTFAFHPQRLESHRAEIAAFCAELPDVFHKSGGGGWSFLNLCMDKHGSQWGEQVHGEALLALAIGTGQGRILFPREMWGSLPGGVPYVWLGL